MTNLTMKEVKHIAKLANLDISQGEVELFSRQLSEILEYVEKLDQEETENVKPLSNVTGKKNVFREDRILPSLMQEECLKNASSTYKGYFKVKAIFEE